jgi:hypothetical protein
MGRWGDGAMGSPVGDGAGGSVRHCRGRGRGRRRRTRTIVAGRWNVRSAMAQAGGRCSLALIGFAEEDAAGAGGAGEDAFTGGLVLEIRVGRDAADGDL